MELLFESRTNLTGYSGHFNMVQHKPEILPEPVLHPDTFVDGAGIGYGSVIRDGGTLRMWYQTIPTDWDYQRDMAGVAYAESDDGITWKKKPLGIVPHGDAPNHLCDFGLHSPSVFIDPDSPPSHRYRGTGCGYQGLFMLRSGVETPGYYTLHSSDGLHWKMDSPEPCWPSTGDVISSIYHPQQKRGIIALKHAPRARGIVRRSIHTADYRDGAYTGQVSALYPDEFDDICAQVRGYNSCDYYGMGMQAAGSGTVGFLWNYWHALPYTDTGWGRAALYGTADISLVYQPEAGGKWFHMPGRPNFVDHREHPWMDGWIYSFNTPVEVGDEHWLYFIGMPFFHGFQLDSNWKRDERWARYLEEYTQRAIGVARWPKYRLFGMEATRDATVTIDMGALTQPVELVLNYKTKPGGSVRVGLAHEPEQSLEKCVPLSGDAIAEKVAWQGGTVIYPKGDWPLSVKVSLELATLYAYEVRPVAP